MESFPQVRKISKTAENILRKRYYADGESSWGDVVDRVINHVTENWDQKNKELIHQMMLNTYFIPNSPCLVNSGKKNGGLLACFVVDFQDSIEEIYKTKLDFALIAKKGGGCGTTLSHLRPQNSPVAGSTHGYSGGPVDFFDTICKDMEVMTQAGFRSMAMMGTMSVRHPDIIKFITVKETEEKMTTTNLSVVVDNEFMEAVQKDETYWTEFNGKKYQQYKARDIFNLIVEGTWRNGEPGLLFFNEINESTPYKYAGVKIHATNPCGEQPLPANGSCNLGSLDVSKFFDQKTKQFDWEKLELATRLSIRFLDSVISKNVFPTRGIEEVSLKSRQVGLGIMGFADLLLMKEISYGSKESLDILENLLQFIYKISKNESEKIGEELGIPEWCQKLPEPRRNITLLSIAPTGSISLLAGCNSGIEPIFSEIIIRNDKTGSYQFTNDLANQPYFKCAVSSNGNEREVTWEEHVNIQASAQKYVDSGVSKTINFPTHTRRETIHNAFMLAWETKCKGITAYRNGSRKTEVLSPKNLKKDKCPICEKDIVIISGKKKCLNCGWKMGEQNITADGAHID